VLGILHALKYLLFTLGGGRGVRKEDIKIPYTTNRIERPMSEIFKPCKQKWMYWSDTSTNTTANSKKLISTTNHSLNWHSIRFLEERAEKRKEIFIKTI